MSGLYPMIGWIIEMHVEICHMALELRDLDLWVSVKITQHTALYDVWSKQLDNCVDTNDINHSELNQFNMYTTSNQ